MTTQQYLEKTIKDINIMVSQSTTPEIFYKVLNGFESWLIEVSEHNIISEDLISWLDNQAAYLLPKDRETAMNLYKSIGK